MYEILTELLQLFKMSQMEIAHIVYNSSFPQNSSVLEISRGSSFFFI